MLSVFYEIYSVWKVCKYEVFSGSYFPVFGLNREIYVLNLRIQSEYRKMRTRKYSVFGHVSRRVKLLEYNNWSVSSKFYYSKHTCSVFNNNLYQNKNNFFRNYFWKEELILTISNVHFFIHGVNYIAQEMKFSIKESFSKCDQIRSFLQTWSHLLKTFLMDKFIFLCSTL